MILEKTYQELKNIIPKENIKLNEPMSKHTSFKIGGPADIFFKVKELQELKDALKIIQKNKIPFRIIGNGSNILVKDEGYRGVIIKNNLEGYIIDSTFKENGNIILRTLSGTKLAVLGQNCMKKEVEGFEFASGIPGTVGGAIKMNAGAHGKEMKDVVESVTYIDEKGNFKTIKNNECEFEYRKSLFSKNNYVIVEAVINLKKGKLEEIKTKMEEYKKYRIDKQPIDFPNGGSTFKRGEGFITAKLIDDAGLKGYAIGDAEVSKKHAGFIVNKGNATAEDVIKLAEYVQKSVYKKFNKKIELEIEII